MNETWINAPVSGGAVGVAGAQIVRIENLYVSAAASTEPAKLTGPIPPCPYPGLAYFGPQDAARFFGRDKAIEALVDAVANRSFTALVGASGSGKSSVVLAGLAPNLIAQGRWRSTYFRIGMEADKNPLAALARALEPLTGERGLSDKLEEVQKLSQKLAAGSISLTNIIGQCRAANPGKRILLIADQFEEAFTFVPDEALRNRFIDALIEAFPDPAPGAAPDICLVLTLRADFYNAALRHRPLADKLQDRVENLGPMTRDELREAIIKPAEQLEPPVTFEPGVAGTILDDVERRPGSLPLLQFALREMWGRLKTPLMTRTDYDAIGGVEGALAKRAQAIFEEATKKETDAASVALFRQLFTRLVTLGEGAEDTRRIVAREELGQQEWALAQKLADEDNRLVVTAATTTGQETVEVAHEALIRNWPALADWVNRDRAFISWRDQLRQRLDDWRKSPSDEGTLLRGGPLAVAEDWVARRGNDLNEEETAFVAKSMELRDAEKLKAEAELQEKQARLKEVAEAQEKTTQAQREMAAAQDKTEQAQRERTAAQERTEQALRETLGAQQRARWALEAIAAVIVAGASLLYWQYSTDTSKLRVGQDQLVAAQSTLSAREQQLAGAQKQLKGAQNALEANEAALRRQRAAAAELQLSLDAKQIELQHQHANLLGELAIAELASGNPDAALRFSAKGSEDDLTLPSNFSRASASAARLAASITNSKWKYAFGTGEAEITSGSFSRDGSRFLATLPDKTACVWDTATGKQLGVLRGHEDRVNAATFSLDRSRIVTASDDKTARVWDVATGKQLGVLRGHEKRVVAAAFSPDGEHIVTASDDDTARIWDSSSGKQLMVLRGFRLTAVAFNSDGSHIVTAQLAGGATVWNASNAQKIATFSGHEPGYTLGGYRGGEFTLSAAISPDGSHIITVHSGNIMRVWDAAKAREVAVLRGHEGPVTAAAFSPDESRIVTASVDKTVRIWNTASGTQIAILRGHEGTVFAAAFSPDSSRIFTASSDRTVRIWDAMSTEEIATLRGHERGVTAAAFSPDGLRILTGGDGRAIVWDAATAKENTILYVNGIFSAAFSPDGSRIVTASEDKTARIWDAASAKEIAVLRGHDSEVKSAAFSPDGKRVVTASADKTARIWDATSAKEIAVLRGHDSGVKSAAFSPDGKRVVTASADKTARIWDAESGTEIAVLRGHEGMVTAATYSPDGTRIVTGSDDNTARIWDAANGKEIAVVRGHEAAVNAAAFSPDGSRIVTASGSIRFSFSYEHASYDDTVRIWDAGTAKEITVLRRHQDRVAAASFSPDGTRIVTGSDDHTARIWDVRFATMSAGGLLNEVCSRRLQGFSTMSRDEMRLAGYFDSEPLIDVCAGIAAARP